MMIKDLTPYKINTTTSWILILLTVVVYYLFGYHVLRTNFNQVFVVYTLVFGLFLLLYYKSTLSTKTLLNVGILFRLVFMFSIPNLSDDFYRFLWDGRALFNGINPYLILPEKNPSLIQNGTQLYQGMGAANGSHYTCYPPLNQLAFTIPAIFSTSNLLISTVVMRVTLIASDILTAYYGTQILKELKLNTRKILLYFINPFAIIELTGNLHYEGMMLAFFSASLYYLLKNKNSKSAILFAGAILIKLIPLIFLPVLFKKLKWIKLIKYGSIVGLFIFLLFLPFLSTTLYQNFMSSIELYFQNFEFNASIYYIVREIGYHTKGYNIIKTVGKITPVLVIIFTLSISFFRKNNHYKVLFTTMLFVIVFYYAMSSIVHPWYIAIPLFLSLFTHYSFPLLWSYLIILSYSAYTSSSYQENLWMVGLEYTLLFTFLFYELYKNNKTKNA